MRIGTDLLVGRDEKRGRILACLTKVLPIEGDEDLLAVSENRH